MKNLVNCIAFLWLIERLPFIESWPRSLRKGNCLSALHDTLPKPANSIVNHIKLKVATAESVVLRRFPAFTQSHEYFLLCVYRQNNHIHSDIQIA